MFPVIAVEGFLEILKRQVLLCFLGNLIYPLLSGGPEASEEDCPQSQDRDVTKHV
jgi:hypothetical protein